MPELDSFLVEIERLIPGKPSEAEQEMRALIATLGIDDLRNWQVDLERTIGMFFPKRRRALLEALGARLDSFDAPAAMTGTHADLDELIVPLKEVLRDLSDHHIFQWATYYHDELNVFFEQILDATSANPGTTILDLQPIYAAFEEHSREVFQKSIAYLVNDRLDSRETVLVKITNGLQRFLDVPLEFYSAHLSLNKGVTSARALRMLCSSVLGGIIAGFSGASDEDVAGDEILDRRPRTWCHVLPFLVSEHLLAVSRCIVAGVLRNGIETVLQPIIDAIDELTYKVSDYAPVPILSQVPSDNLRLDISLEPPPFTAFPQPLDVHCYLDPSSAQRAALQEAARRDVALIVGSFPPDLVAAISSEELLGQRVVITRAEAANVNPSRQRIVPILEYAIYRRRSARLGSQPLRYNFARGFPLQNPFLTRYFHVHRSSVNDLLRTFERRNGVRLWCSVRRSGKTTACVDLGSTTGDSRVVVQTCASTGQLPGSTTFYDAVVDRVVSGKQLPRTFIADLVAKCADEGSARDNRFVFVLDEYETLFGRIQAAARSDSALRYTVLQPLLDQMVAFTQANLLVLLGQQPNAHFVLMDQNQLSPYVEQDSFPLFRHDEDSTNTEFSELIRKVLADRATFNGQFASALFSETGGHPYLTVNLLVELVDWLMEIERPTASLSFVASDFEEFSETKLTPKRVGLSPEYAFFREAISEATGTDGRRDAPWLHAVYACMRELARTFSMDTVCSRTDFDDIVKTVNLEELGMTSDSILTTASQANFFAFDGDSVRARIPLLARIAGVTRPRVVA